MQKSLHLHIMMFILWKRNTAEKWWRVGGGKKNSKHMGCFYQKKKEKRKHTHHAALYAWLTCCASYVSGFRVG